MPTIGVVARVRDCERVIAATRAHLRALGEAESKRRAALGDAGQPAFSEITSLALAELSRDARALRDEDQRFAHALEEDPDAAGARDAALDPLHEELRALRGFLAAVYRPAFADALGVTVPIPRDATGLLSYAATVVSGLRQSAPPMRPRIDVRWNQADMARSIEQRATALEAAMARQPASDGARPEVAVHRDQALAHYDARFNQAAGLLAALFRFAGLETAAAELTPSTRCPGRLEREDGQELQPSEEDILVAQ